MTPSSFTSPGHPGFASATPSSADPLQISADFSVFTSVTFSIFKNAWPIGSCQESESKNKLLLEFCILPPSREGEFEELKKVRQDRTPLAGRAAKRRNSVWKSLRQARRDF